MKEKLEIGLEGLLRRNRKLEMIWSLILLLLLMWTGAAGQQVLKGRVIDAESKKTLIFANILVKGTSIGTATDSNGNFELTVSSPDSIILEFSSVGYNNLELNLDTVDISTFIEIEMFSDGVTLSDHPVIRAPRILEIG